MARPQRTCPCGHTKTHEHVVEEPEYTLWGWILLSMFGMTPKPDHVVYRCQMCRQSVGSTRDPKILARRTVQARTGASPTTETSDAPTAAREGSQPDESPRT